MDGAEWGEKGGKQERDRATMIDPGIFLGIGARKDSEYPRGLLPKSGVLGHNL